MHVEAGAHLANAGSIPAAGSLFSRSLSATGSWHSETNMAPVDGDSPCLLGVSDLLCCLLRSRLRGWCISRWDATDNGHRRL